MTPKESLAHISDYTPDFRASESVQYQQNRAVTQRSSYSKEPHREPTPACSSKNELTLLLTAVGEFYGMCFLLEF